MSKIQKIKEILKFLETKHDVKFQLQLIDIEEPTSSGEDLKFDGYKFCKSSIHNTDNLICFYYYKKNF
jgi:hypothetical protein